MQVRTNLIQFAVIALEVGGFILCEAHKCVLPSLFASESTTPINHLANPNAWPKTRNNKAIW